MKNIREWGLVIVMMLILIVSTSTLLTVNKLSEYQDVITDYRYENVELLEKNSKLEQENNNLKVKNIIENVKMQRNN